MRLKKFFYSGLRYNHNTQRGSPNELPLLPNIAYGIS
nr:MAG TPA: hypothetical protein [Caudoviricetes sp.]